MEGPVRDADRPLFYLFLLANMLGADLVRCKQAEERYAVRSTFDGGAAVGLFALDDADHGGNGHAGFAGSLDGVHSGGAGGADVIHNDNAGARAAEALDAATGSVRLFGLANQKSVEQWSAGVGERAPSAGGGHVGDDGVRAQGEPANGLGLNSVLFKQFKDRMTGEASALGVEGGGAAVDVIVARAAGGELELAKAETGPGEES